MPLPIYGGIAEKKQHGTQIERKLTVSLIVCYLFDFAPSFSQKHWGDTHTPTRLSSHVGKAHHLPPRDTFPATQSLKWENYYLSGKKYAIAKCVTITLALLAIGNPTRRFWFGIRITKWMDLRLADDILLFAAFNPEAAQSSAFKQVHWAMISVISVLCTLQVPIWDTSGETKLSILLCTEPHKHKFHKLFRLLKIPVGAWGNAHARLPSAKFLH